MAGEYIKRKRKKAGMTSRDLAHQLGVSPGYISKIELGRGSPSPETLTSLVRCFDLNDTETKKLESMIIDELVAEYKTTVTIRYTPFVTIGV